MSYQGGKQRLGNRIYEVIREVEKYFFGETKLTYFEPFVGFCGVMKHFAVEEKRKCEGSDINKDVILMWKGLQEGWKPPQNCSKKRYEKEKRSRKHSAERGFLGTACSYGGIFFVGYRSIQRYKHKTIKSASMTRRKIMKVSKMVKNVKFLNSKSYREFSPKNKLIYCDPPYEDNKYHQNEHFSSFDHSEFWETMRKWSKDNLVVVSERVAPCDFKAIWKCDTHSTQNGKVNKQKETLFIHDIFYEHLSRDLKKHISNI